jgi:hypothetical protein
MVHGWQGLPVYDLGKARYALGNRRRLFGRVGVASILRWGNLGHFRQGRPGLRGRLVQAESRFSVTAQSADQWLPVRPGSEPQFAGRDHAGAAR